MSLKTLLAGGAIASLALVVDVSGVTSLATISHAEAATSVSISLFYNDLADDGSWVNYRNSYVFIPSGVRAGWRPYADGHWVYVEDAGWTWVSNERFGWATYHYGRWGYDGDIGWYWVPGTRWAPAWVSWRRSNDYVVWAPLPPDQNNDVSVSVTVGNVPDFYWVAVPTRSFLDVDLRVNLVDNDRVRERVVRNSRFIGTSRVRNDVVVNNVIDVNVIERETGRKVKRLRAQETDNPREARATDNQVTVFRGEMKKDANAKPQRVQDEAQVRKIRRDENQTGNQNDTGTASGAAAPNSGQGQNQQDQTGTADTGKTSAKDRANSGASTRQNQNQNAATAVQKRKKPATGSDQNNTDQNNAASGQTSKDEVTTGSTGKANDQRRSRPSEAVGKNPDQQNNRAVQQPSNENKATDQNNSNIRKQTQKPTPGAQQGNAQKKRKQNCNPSTDANCAQQ